MRTENRFTFAYQFPLFFVFIFVLEISIFGQSSATTGAITGIVKNSAGEIIADASINLRDTATNQTRQIKSQMDGSFRLTALTVGIYEVRVESQGFAAYINPQITIALGQTTTLDITLQPAGVSEAVTVSGQSPVIDVSQTASTTSIDPERIEELPVNSRNYLQFTLTAPGVAPSNTQTASGGRNISNSPLADSGFSFGGLRPRSNSISIDGLDNTDETTGAARIALSPEIVREFQIINNGISAEFGGAAGGAINVVTKTGANDFHGTLFNFIQNERLNARDPLFGNNSNSRLRFRRFQPGASLGGAIIRDKLFFYTAVEQEIFSADEESEINRNVRSQINTALASGFAPRLAVRFLNGRPFRVGADETEAAGKLTYLVNSQNTVNLRFAFSNNRARGEAFNTDALTDNLARSSYTKDYALTGSVISVLSPETINDFHFQASTRRVLSRSGNTNGTGIEIVGLARFGQPFNADETRRETRQQFVDTISFVRGNHELKTGANVNHVSFDSDLRDGFNGFYTFRTVEDFLAARPAIFRQAFGNPHTNFAVTNVGAFAQDHWQFSPKLTFNLGLRYDLEQLPKPFRTDKNNFSPRLGVAFSLSKDLIIRAGFGLFYDRLPLAFLNPAIQKNGVQAFEQIAFDMDAAQAFVNNGGGRQSLLPIPSVAPSIYRADPNFKTPYSIQTFAGIERLISSDTTVRAEFLFTRGINLPRTRNINLLPPVLLTTANAVSLGIQNPTSQQLRRLVFGTGRINPRFDAIYQLEDSASSTYPGLSLSVNKHLSNEFEFLASYTLSKAIDDASDFNEQPANPYDLRAERAPSLQDVRHRFVASGIFELPFGDEDAKGKGGEKDSLLKEIFGNIEIAPIITFSSGRPVNALTGTDEERSRAFPLVSRPLGFFRNALRTPNFFNTDLRIVKYIPLNEKGAKVDFAFEVFNLFNKPNVVAINQFYGFGSAPISTFGTPILFNSPRQFRFSLDLEF